VEVSVFVYACLCALGGCEGVCWVVAGMSEKLSCRLVIPRRSSNPAKLRVPGLHKKGLTRGSDKSTLDARKLKRNTGQVAQEGGSHCLTGGSTPLGAGLLRFTWVYRPNNSNVTGVYEVHWNEYMFILDICFDESCNLVRVDEVFHQPSMPCTGTEL